MSYMRTYLKDPQTLRAGEMAQALRALAAFAEDQSVSTHIR